MTGALTPPPLVVHGGGDRRQELIADVREGLTSTPKQLHPRWFYDEEGSRLFEAITGLPEYYQTRTEIAILEAASAEIAAAVRPEYLVELGAGSCTKSRLLIEACRGAAGLRAFIPFDISEAALRDARHELLALYPDLVIEGIVGDFANHLELIPRRGRQLVAFLGGTIGNFDDAERRRFLDGVRGLLEPGDAFLLGLDLVKPVPDLLAAYDDSQGITAAFNLNLLAVLNRELGAGFDPAAFEHSVRYDRDLNRMEMWLRSTRAQTVEIPAASMRVSFDRGEAMRTEISVKFAPAMVESLLAASSMSVARWFTDAESRFGVVLATPV